MAVKEIKFGQDAMNSILHGSELFSKTVGITLGPNGRNVLYDKSFVCPTVTKDGVTVAKEIDLENHFENIGCQLIKEAASKSSDVTGDGTTTTTILAYEILKEGNKLIAAGHNPIDIVSGIKKATSSVIDFLHAHKKFVCDKQEIEHIGFISSNGDREIGNMIAEAIDMIGQDGVITVEESQSIESSLNVIEGVKIESGYISTDFLGDEISIEFENPYILTVDKKISTFRDMADILNQIIEEDRPLLVICENIISEALTTLIMNNKNNVLKSCAVRAPSVGEKQRDIIKDISIITGGSFISDELGMSLKTISLNDLGQAEKVIITRKSTLILGGKGKTEYIQQRIHEIKNNIHGTWSAYDIERMQDRLGRLVGGIAVIKVGSYSEVELKEKKARVEDALNATQSAISSGILPGGGIALLRSAYHVSEMLTGNVSNTEQYGVNILVSSLSSPIKKIISNGFVDPTKVLNGINVDDEFSFGYDAKSNEFIDMYERGIIDPANVIIEALTNASSIASMLLTTHAAVVNQST
jgi:chaperonin GroEL